MIFNEMVFRRNQMSPNQVRSQVFIGGGELGQYKFINRKYFLQNFKIKKNCIANFLNFSNCFENSLLY